MKYRIYRAFFCQSVCRFAKPLFPLSTKRLYNIPSDKTSDSPLQNIHQKKRRWDSNIVTRLCLYSRPRPVAFQVVEQKTAKQSDIKAKEAHTLPCQHPAQYKTSMNIRLFPDLFLSFEVFLQTFSTPPRFMFKWALHIFR